ncbi:MAG: hypothetical protein ACFFCQ_07200 [Promethearchaeota archaeon]
MFGIEYELYPFKAEGILFDPDNERDQRRITEICFYMRRLQKYAYVEGCHWQKWCAAETERFSNPICPQLGLDQLRINDEATFRLEVHTDHTRCPDIHTAIQDLTDLIEALKEHSEVYDVPIWGTVLREHKGKKKVTIAATPHVNMTLSYSFLPNNDMKKLWFLNWARLIQWIWPCMLADAGSPAPEFDKNGEIVKDSYGELEFVGDARQIGSGSIRAGSTLYYTKRSKETGIWEVEFQEGFLSQDREIDWIIWLRDEGIPAKPTWDTSARRGDLRHREDVKVGYCLEARVLPMMPPKMMKNYIAVYILLAERAFEAASSWKIIPPAQYTPSGNIINYWHHAMYQSVRNGWRGLIPQDYGENLAKAFGLEEDDIPNSTWEEANLSSLYAIVVQRFYQKYGNISDSAYERHCGKFRPFAQGVNKLRMEYFTKILL